MAVRSSAAILSSAMRVRRPTSASASVFALATISSASCLARSSSPSRSLSIDAALASYSAFSASASLRNDSASASWSRISAILESSALPIAPGTFFQMRMAKTTSIATATQPPGSRPRKVASDMKLRLHRLSGVLRVHFNAGQARDHVLRGFGRHRLDFCARRVHGLTNLRLGRLDLQIDLVRSLAHLRLSVLRARLLRLVGDARGLGSRRVHARPPCRFGLVGSDARLLCRLEVGRDLLFARVHRRLDAWHHAPRDHEEDESEPDRQPEQLRQENVGKLVKLRHLALERVEDDHRDGESHQAKEFGSGEADEQPALLAVGGRWIAQRTLQERAEDEADADCCGANTDCCETGADDLGGCEIHD